jgi:hypothetical protein
VQFSNNPHLNPSQSTGPKKKTNTPTTLVQHFQRNVQALTAQKKTIIHHLLSKFLVAEFGLVNPHLSESIQQTPIAPKPKAPSYKTHLRN